MTAILAKKEEDIKKGRSMSISMLTTTQDSRGQKRKYPYNTTSNEKQYVKKQNNGAKGNGKNVSSTSNVPQE